MVLTWTLVCAVDLSSSTWSWERWSLNDSRFLKPANSQPVQRHMPWLNKGWEDTVSSAALSFVLSFLSTLLPWLCFNSVTSLFSFSTSSFSLLPDMVLCTKDLVWCNTEGRYGFSDFLSSISGFWNYKSKYVLSIH